MAENQRYEPVAIDNPDAPSPTPVNLMVAAPVPPPPYDGADDTEQGMQPQADNDGAVTVELPPAYDVAAKLPTYEEAERLQQDYDQLVERNVILLDGGVEVSLGNDWLFLACFIIAFVFNWIGFFAAYCMTKTVAGRYGAISGFGLSVVKWILILKRAASEDMLFTQSWFWWLLVALGWLIFIRAILVYVHIKMCVKKGRRYFPRFWGLPE